MSERDDIPNVIHETIFSSADLYPEKAALVSAADQDKAYTYSDVAAKVKLVAAFLNGMGIARQDRVGIIGDNCPEWAIFYLSILAAGAVAVPLDNNLKESEVAALLRISGVRIIACSSKWLIPVRNVIGLNGLDIKPVDLGGAVGGASTDSAGTYSSPDTKPHDTAAIIFTSGTTGDPKGVILTHDNIVSNVKAARTALQLLPDDKFLSILPLHHTFEATCGFLLPLICGLTIVYARSLKSREIKEDIDKYKITVMVAVPLLYEKMYASIVRKIAEAGTVKKTFIGAMHGISGLAWKARIKAGRPLFASLRKQAGLSSIRMFVSGGAPLPVRVAEWFNLAGFTFLEGYGMTECSPVISVNHPDDIRFGSVGSPLPGLDVRIDNPGPNGIGEISVKGSSVSPGYLDNQAATAELIKDGWLMTGDLGKIDRGHIYITGRAKNLIVSGAGKNIYPEEIEAELDLSPCISEAIVLGRARSGKAGEEVWAIIYPCLEQIQIALGEQSPVPEKIRELMQSEIRAVNERIADFKRIVNFEIRTEPFEKTSTRKIKRNLYR